MNNIHMSLHARTNMLLAKHYSDLSEEKRLRIERDLLKTAYPELWVSWSHILKAEIDNELSEAFEKMKPYTGKNYDEEEWQEIYNLSYKEIWHAVLSGYTEDFQANYIEGSSWGQSIGEAIQVAIDQLASELDMQANF